MADVIYVQPLYPLVQTLYTLRISGWLTFAATILFLYDILLTIEGEITLIWKRKWSFSSVIYLINRYGVLMQAGLSNIPNLDPLLSGKACQGWQLFMSWSIPIVLMMTEATLVLRVTALYMHARSISIPLWCLYVFCGAAMCLVAAVNGIGNTEIFRDKLAQEVVGCLLVANDLFFWTIWIPSLILETILFIMTMTRIAYHVRAGAETRILGLMARDGVMYFLVIFAILLLNVVLAITASTVYSFLIEQASWMPLPSRFLSPSYRPILVLISIMCSRLYLNIREVAYDSDLVLTQPTPVPLREIRIDSWAASDASRVTEETTVSV